MDDVEVEVREWGRSLGVVIPKRVVSHEGIRAGDRVVLRIGRSSNALKECFGTHRFKQNTNSMIREARKGAWDE